MVSGSGAKAHRGVSGEWAADHETSKLAEKREQQLGLPLTAYRPTRRCGAHLVEGVRVCSPVKKQLYHLRNAILCRQMQERPPHVAASYRKIGIRASLQQDTNIRNLLTLNRRPQRSPAPYPIFGADP